ASKRIAPAPATECGPRQRKGSRRPRGPPGTLEGFASLRRAGGSLDAKVVDPAGIQTGRRGCVLRVAERDRVRAGAEPPVLGGPGGVARDPRLAGAVDPELEVVAGVRARPPLELQGL